MRGLVVAVAVGCAGVTLGACFSSGSSGHGGGTEFDASFDASFDSSLEASADVTSPDAPVADGSPPDVQQPESGSDGGTLCTHLDLSSAPFVNMVGNVTGAAPAMTGGTIVPGDYVETTIVAYDPAGTVVSGESPSRSIFRFGASSRQADTQVWFAYDAGPDSPPDGENVLVVDYVAAGNTLTTTLVCDLLVPDAGPVMNTNQYTATATTFAFPRPVADAGIVEIVTYTKQ